MMTNDEVKVEENLWTLPFILILIINSANGIGSFMVNPSMPDYLVSRGMAFELTGVISSLLSWVALTMRPFSGAMSDKLNKKILMFISYFVSALCMFAYFYLDSLPLVIATRIIHGLAFAISGTISMAFATSFVPKKRIAEGIGYIGVASMVGQMFGPRLGALISDYVGLNYIFLVSAVIYGICLIIIGLVPYKYKKKDTELRKFKFDDFFAKDLLIFVFIVGLFSFGNGIISYYLTSFGKERGIADISKFFTVYSFAMLCMKPFVGKIQDKFGINTILYPAIIIYAIGVVVLANSYTLLPVLIAAILKAIGQGNGTPAVQAEAVKKLGLERNGVAFSACLIGQDLGNGLGPIFASYLIKATNYTTMLCVYAGLLILAFVIYYVYCKRNEVKE